MRLLLLSLILLTKIAHGTLLDVKVTEIMYNPNPEGILPSTSLEFIELKNTGLTAVDMSGVQFIDGIIYAFPFGTTLLAGDFIVLVSDSNSFHVRYQTVPVDGQYFGSMRNTGERIVMTVGLDTLVNIKYNDNHPWPFLADGSGFSMVPVINPPILNQNDGEDWRTSTNKNGSPGADDPTVQVFPDVYVNELLSHTDLPDLDAVELYNASADSVNIGNWLLSDNRNNLGKYKFPANTFIPAGGYIYVDEVDFNPGGLGYRFNRSGDNVYLASADSSGNLLGFGTGWSFGAEYNGVSFGVYTNSVGARHFVAQSAITLGAVNAYPRVGPIVITDINYNPTTVGDEYLVLKNIADTVVNLWETTALTDSTWEVSGCKFAFPINTSMLPGEQVVLTRIVASSFRIKYNISNSVKVYQYTGRLSNAGETIAVWSLLRSDTAGVNNDSVFVPKILIDKVRYNDKSPWPVTADGLGDFLRRTVNTEYGNDPVNWNQNNGSVLHLDEGSNSTFTVYPNPATNHVQINTAGLRNASFTLRDALGKTVRHGMVKSDVFYIERRNLRSGMYFLEISSALKSEFGNVIFK